MGCVPAGSNPRICGGIGRMAGERESGTLEFELEPEPLNKTRRFLP